MDDFIGAFLRIEKFIHTIGWQFFIVPFLHHSFLANLHVPGNWAFSCLIHSKIPVNDLDALDEPFHG